MPTLLGRIQQAKRETIGALRRSKSSAADAEAALLSNTMPDNLIAELKQAAEDAASAYNLYSAFLSAMEDKS
jgi:hypothetical protein